MKVIYINSNDKLSPEEQHLVGKIETTIYPYPHYPSLPWPNDVPDPYLPPAPWDKMIGNLYVPPAPDKKKHRFVEVDETTRKLEVKVPGLSEEEIVITVDTDNNTLTVGIDPKDVSFYDCEGFVFPLKKYEEVKSAKMKDGILTIVLVTKKQNSDTKIKIKKG